MAYNKETGMYEGFIYIIINDIDPELVYIGQTYDTPESRWRGHCLQVKKHSPTDRLHNKMEKYGILHFAMEVLEHHKLASKQELIKRLDEREIALIEKFDSYYNGLNCTKGGRGAMEHKKRPVQRFDLDGNFIAEYDAIESLKLEFDSVSSIYGCCGHTNNAKYAYGSMWRYVDDNTPLPILTEKEKHEAIARYRMLFPINEYDYKGTLLNTYKNAEELLSQNCSINRQDLINCCTGKKVYIGTNIYRFQGDDLNKYKTYREKSKLVEQYDIDGNFIRVFESAREASRFVGVKGSQVSDACRGNRKTVGGYMWKYVENNHILPDLNHNKHCIKVYQYRKDTLKLDKIFNSVKDAGLYNNIGPATISKSARGITTSIMYNYIWSFNELSKDELLNRMVNKNAKPVVRLKENGEYIDEYVSLKKAAQTLFPDKNNADANISAAIKNNRIAYGFRWVFKNDYYKEVKHVEDKNIDD